MGLRTASVPLLAVVLVGCAAVASVPPEPPRQLAVSARIHTFALKNGMRVVVLEDRNTDLVYVGARYDVGAIEDPDDKHGLAHLVEHIAFLPRVAGQRLDTRLAATALGTNAMTTWDYTHYYAVARADQLEPLLEVESMRLQPGICLTVSDEDFAREREVVLNELRARYGEDGADGLSTKLAAAYPEGHPYRRLVGGTEPQVASIAKTDACAFVDRYYVPAHVTVVISGNVGKDEAAAIVDRTLGRVPGRAPVARKPPPPIAPHGSRTVHKAIDAPTLYTIWALPPMMTEARAAAELAMDRIEGKIRNWNRDNKFANSIDFRVFGGEYAPVAVLEIELSSAKRADDARDWIGKAVKRFDEGSNDAGFVMSKQFALSQLIRGLDSLAGRAERFADFLQLADGRQGYLIEEIARLDQLGRDFVRTVGKEVFATGKASSLLMLVDESQRRAYRPVALTYAGSGHGGESRTIPVAPGEAERKLSVEMSQSKLPEARRFRLDNGIEVALLPSSSVPIVDIRLVFGGGASVEPADKAGLADVAANLLSPDFESVTVREQIDVMIKFSKVGGSVAAWADADATTFRVVGLEGYFDILLAGLERTVKAGVYHSRSVEAFQDGARSALKKRGTASMLARQRAIYRAVYGPEHPYADRGIPSPRSIGRIGVDALQDYRSRYFVASNATLVVTGKFDPDLMEKHIRFRFGHWGSGSPARPVDQAPAAAGSVFKIESDDQPTVSIDVLYPVVDGDRDRAAWLVLEGMLEARVGNVRSDMGASYGIHARLELRRGPGMMHISGKVDRRRAGAALKALLAAIDGLRRGEGELAADFVVARRQVAGRYATATNSASESAEMLVTAVFGQRGLRFANVMLANVAGLAPAAVQKLLRSQLAPARRSIVVHGPRADVDRALAEAGVGNATWFE